MTSRERELAAIRHQIPDRIPVDRICIETQPEIAAYLGIEPERVEDELGIDGRVVAPGFQGEGPKNSAGEAWDEWGTAALQDYGTAHPYPLAGASSVAVVERYPWPDAADYDYEGAARLAREWGGKYAVRGPYWKPLFCRVASLFGLENALIKMATEPAVFEAALEKVTDHTAELCRRFLAACGDSVPILCLGDDFATQRGLMISPEHWRRFIKPCLARVFEVGKRMGKAVWFHSCGDVTAVLGDLIDIGAEVWETVQLHALPRSPRELKRHFGRHLAFFGGVNTQRLPFATPDEVRDETIRCIEMLGEGGGYICGPDHHIKPDVPPENAVALFRAATGFRREGYTARAGPQSDP
jgi:uroporphyrinogen decarboxylase